MGMQGSVAIPIAALDAAEDGLGTNCDGCRDRIADALATPAVVPGLLVDL